MARTKTARRPGSSSAARSSVLAASQALRRVQVWIRRVGGGGVPGDHRAGTPGHLDGQEEQKDRHPHEKGEDEPADGALG